MPLHNLQSHRTIGRFNNNRKKRLSSTFIQAVVITFLVVILVMNLLWMRRVVAQQQDPPVPSTLLLRQYPPHRYYHLQVPISQQPDFLTTQTEYIYGEWPILLDTMQQPVKLTVNQSEWHVPNKDQQPFADGTNPSILTLARLTRQAPAVAAGIQQHYPTAYYLATVCMTNSQCSWQDSPTEMQQFHLATQSKPDTVRTVLLVLNKAGVVLDQTTIYLQRNAVWGKLKPGSRHLPALDDARLFVHKQQVWVSYREGPGFGWERQVLNPIHLDFSGIWQAWILASETTSFCCGRNMALMPGPQDQLEAVTWVDPVTTVVVDTTPTQQQKQQRRRLSKNNKHKSHVHGTNAFMVDLPDGHTHLGVAHFHRPNDRKANPFARFGHHYTHAFYTIQNNHLVALSAEFVLKSAYRQDDAEVIQFASGLEFVDHKVVIAYGINDCEAAMTVVDWSVVEQMLRPVPVGKQVVDFMKPLLSTG